MDQRLIKGEEKYCLPCRDMQTGEKCWPDGPLEPSTDVILHDQQLQDLNKVKHCCIIIHVHVYENVCTHQVCDHCFSVFPWAVPQTEHTSDTLRAEDGRYLNFSTHYPVIFVLVYNS